MVIHKSICQNRGVSLLVLPVAVLTADEGGLIAVEVDVSDAGVVRRDTREPIDLVSLVKLIERERGGSELELEQLELELALG